MYDKIMLRYGAFFCGCWLLLFLLLVQKKKKQKEEDTLCQMAPPDKGVAIRCCPSALWGSMALVFLRGMYF